MDQRVTWSIDWRELRDRILLSGGLTREDAQLLQGRVPYYATLERPLRRQVARILLATPLGAPNQHPMQIYVGSLAELAYQLGVQRVPAGFCCDRVTLGGETWYGAEVEQRYPLRRQLVMSFRLGIGGSPDKETMPRRDIRREFSLLLDTPEADVWPWVFMQAFVRLHLDYVHIPHIHERDRVIGAHAPGAAPVSSMAMLYAQGHWFSVKGRTGERGFRIYAAKCAECRRIYWMMAVRD